MDKTNNFNNLTIWDICNFNQIFSSSNKILPSKMGAHYSYPSRDASNNKVAVRWLTEDTSYQQTNEFPQISETKNEKRRKK